MQLTQRLAAIEAQLVALSQAAGVPCPSFPSTVLQGGGPPPSDPLAEVVALARAGRTIDAIKRFRELTGAGLHEAKQAVEAM